MNRFCAALALIIVLPAAGEEVDMEWIEPNLEAGVEFPAHDPLSRCFGDAWLKWTVGSIFVQSNSPPGLAFRAKRGRLVVTHLRGKRYVFRRRADDVKGMADAFEACHTGTSVPPHPSHAYEYIKRAHERGARFGPFDPFRVFRLRLMHELQWRMSPRHNGS